MLPHSGRQILKVIQSPLSVTGTAAWAVLDLVITLPPLLPGPSEPQLSVLGAKDSMWGKGRPRGEGNVLSSVVAGKSLLSSVGRRHENVEARGQGGDRGQEVSRPLLRR